MLRDEIARAPDIKRQRTIYQSPGVAGPGMRVVLPIPLVTGWNLLPFVRFLRGIGAPVERWLAESRISADIIERPDRAFPLGLGLDFVDRAAREEGAESIGLDVGRHESADSLGSLGALLARCPTLYSRACAACRLISSANNYSSMWLEVIGETATIYTRLHCKREPGLRHAEDFTLMLVLEAVERAAGPGWKPSVIQLPGSRPQRFTRDELFQGVSMFYAARNIAVSFPAELLGHALRPPPRVLSCAQPAAAHPAGGVPPTDFVESLEEAVVALLANGCPSVHDLAEISHLSPRTLQRRLAEEGASLRQIIDHARFRLAVDYLGDCNATITDIAMELGYSDSTAFTRAFHRMTGVSPSQFRARQLDS